MWFIKLTFYCKRTAWKINLSIICYTVRKVPCWAIICYCVFYSVYCELFCFFTVKSHSIIICTGYIYFYSIYTIIIYSISSRTAIYSSITYTTHYIKSIFIIFPIILSTDINIKYIITITTIDRCWRSWVNCVITIIAISYSINSIYI